MYSISKMIVCLQAVLRQPNEILMRAGRPHVETTILSAAPRRPLRSLGVVIVYLVISGVWIC
jgi:hypothetical protein